MTRLYALCCVERDLPWFVAEGELPAKAARSVPEAVRAAVMELGPQVRACVRASACVHMCARVCAEGREGGVLRGLTLS